MSTKRVKSQETVDVQKKTRRTKTAGQIDQLDAMEDKVFRMHHGVTVEEETELAFLDEMPGMPPEVAAQIRAMERRALEMQGQLQPLSAKDKIISNLKKKSR